MRLTKSLAFAVSALALSTGAAFAGEAALTDRSDPMGYQPYAFSSYEQGGPETLSESELIGALEMLDRGEYAAQTPDYVYDVYIANELG